MAQSLLYNTFVQLKHFDRIGPDKLGQWHGLTFGLFSIGVAISVQEAIIALDTKRSKQLNKRIFGKFLDRIPSLRSAHGEDKEEAVERLFKEIEFFKAEDDSPFSHVTDALKKAEALGCQVESLRSEVVDQAVLKLELCVEKREFGGKVSSVFLFAFS